MNCNDFALTAESRGECTDGTRPVVFTIVLSNVLPDSVVIGTLYTGDTLTGGEEFSFPVYYGVSDQETALWADGSDSGSKAREFEHHMAPGSYSAARLELIQPECPSIPIVEFRVDECAPPPPCPEVIFNDVSRSQACNESGEWDLTFEATALSAELTGSFQGVELVTTGDGNIEESPFPISNQSSYIDADGHRVFQGAHSLPPGTYRIRLVTTCGTSGNDVLLPECDHVCPIITFPMVTSGIDCIDGDRINNITVDVRYPPGQKGGELQVEVVDENGNVLETSEVSLTGELTLVVSHPFPPGEHTLTVNVLRPEECSYPDGSDQITFESIACGEPPPDPCPEVVFFNAVPSADCDAQFRRSVAMTASVSIPPEHDGTVTATLSDGDGPIASGSADSGTITLAGSRNYTAGANTVTVTATSDRCDAASTFLVQVPNCPTPPQPPPRINWCAIALIILLVMLAVGAIATGVGFCGLGLIFWGPVNAALSATAYGVAIAVVIMVIVIIVGLFLLLLGTIGIIIWLVTCGTCRLNCFWIDVLIDVLLFFSLISGILAVIGAIIAFFQVSTICWIGWAIDFVDFIVLFWIAYWFSRVVGCRPWPAWVPQWARFTWPARWRFTCRFS